MTAAYDPALCERLIAEVKTPGSRDRAGLRAAIADQLEAARAEVERLRSDLDHATAHDGDHLSKASRRMVDTVMGDRDALRLRVTDLERRLSEMTDAAAGATADANRALEREQAALARASERTTKSVTGFDYTDVNARLDAETTAFPTDEDLP